MADNGTLAMQSDEPILRIAQTPREASMPLNADGAG